MLYLLLGPDDFSKKEYIDSLAQKDGLEVDIFAGPEGCPPINKLTEKDLFSKTRIYVLKEAAAQYEFTDENLGLLAGSDNHIIFIQEKLDKRNAGNKKILTDKRVAVQNFPLPHGKEVNDWLVKRTKFLQGEIAPDAAELLAVRMGRDQSKETKIAGKIIETKEVFDMWQLDSEIRKLLSLARGKIIEKSDVENLSSANEEADVLDVINAIGEGNKKNTLRLLGKLLEAEGGDEKAKIIQLNALLCDQFRSIAVVQDFTNKRVSEADVLAKTSWKSGRLFVMKKIASKFSSQKVLETLKKLEALDEELKTSNMSPQVLLDLIVVQMF